MVLCLISLIIFWLEPMRYSKQARWKCYLFKPGSFGQKPRLCVWVVRLAILLSCKNVVVSVFNVDIYFCELKTSQSHIKRYQYLMLRAHSVVITELINFDSTQWRDCLYTVEGEVKVTTFSNTSATRLTINFRCV